MKNNVNATQENGSNGNNPKRNGQEQNRNTPRSTGKGNNGAEKTAAAKPNGGQYPRGSGRNFQNQQNNKDSNNHRQQATKSGTNGKNSANASLNLSLSGHENPTIFERFATRVSKAAGSTPAFIGALLIVLGWAVCGPLFNFSETWQLVINTGTTIITFLMVFLIQKAQNKDSLAIQLKLNELVASHEYSSNRLVDIESMTEDEMIIVQKYYRSLSELSKKDEKLQTSHSIEEAEDQHEAKSSKRAKRYRSGNPKKKPE